MTSQLMVNVYQYYLTVLTVYPPTTGTEEVRTQSLSFRNKIDPKLSSVVCLSSKGVLTGTNLQIRNK